MSVRSDERLVEAEREALEAAALVVTLKERIANERKLLDFAISHAEVAARRAAELRERLGVTGGRP